MCADKEHKKERGQKSQNKTVKTSTKNNSDISFLRRGQLKNKLLNSFTKKI